MHKTRILNAAAALMGIPTGRIVLNGWPHGFGFNGSWVKDYAAWLETIFADNET